MAKTKPADALIGKRVRINQDCLDIFGSAHMWAGLYGEVIQSTGGGQYSIAVGERIKNFPMEDFTLNEDATGQYHSALVDVPPSAAVFSLTNPRRRKGLDIDSISALAASLKVHGLAQPILVRPLPPHRLMDTAELSPRPIYEVIAGERRWRAAQVAGLPTMPMLVRDITDSAVLELQLVENIEREDLDPMEEAEGFELLRSKLGYTVDAIAERIGRGKGTSYIRKSMKLLDLTADSREAMHQGHLSRSTGLLVSRYMAYLQAEVVEYIKAMATDGEPAPFRKVAPAVFTHFNLALATAVFDIKDATLDPTAGACTDCPKRSGAQEDIFGDPNSPDNCTDANCFAVKKSAHIDRTRDSAQRDGLSVVDGEEARRAKPSPHSQVIQGFVRLSDTAFIKTCDDGEEREVTYEDALRSMGKKAPKPRIFIDPHSGASEKVITLDLADKLTPAEPEPPAKERKQASPKVDNTPPEIKALRDGRIQRAVMFRIFDIIRNTERTPAEMLLVAKSLLIRSIQEQELPHTEQYLGWADDLNKQDIDVAARIISEKLDAMNNDQISQAVAMAAVEIAITSWAVTTEEGSLDIVKSYGIDVLAVQDKVADDLARQDAAARAEGGAV